ncbi:MAG: response regulator [Roseibium sp.]|uniref:response regulator n=1 Tax=Roseibium sp. TaxID=1936156 RepID=UPI001B22FF60|nr:response regulator [Roseibium sp.]MBO6895664.1 response regulator [Roseibium sp.]
MIVDDNQYACALASAQLKSLGITQTKYVASGAEALLCMQTERYDVLLMDWYMPDVSGAGLLSVVRDQRFAGNSNIAVVVMTAYASSENIERALSLGANEVVIKPIDPKSVGKAIAKALAETQKQLATPANDEFELDALPDDDEEGVALL